MTVILVKIHFFHYHKQCFLIFLMNFSQWLKSGRNYPRCWYSQGKTRSISALIADSECG